MQPNIETPESGARQSRSANANLPEVVRAWVERFSTACDEDEELQTHGKLFSCSYPLDFGEHRILLRMNRGKVDELVVDPGPLDERYQFAIRASPDTWRGFGEPVPPPMSHGIWSATFRKDMKLEGDILVLMQNLREVTRQIELLRQTGVPIAGTESSSTSQNRSTP